MALLSTSGQGTITFAEYRAKSTTVHLASARMEDECTPAAKSSHGEASKQEAGGGVSACFKVKELLCFSLCRSQAHKF